MKIGQYMVGLVTVSWDRTGRRLNIVACVGYDCIESLGWI